MTSTASMRVLETTPLLLLVLAMGCEDETRILPYTAETELAGVTFRLEAVKEVFESPRPLNSCTRGDACLTYLGRFFVRIRTSRPFTTIQYTTIERGPHLAMFDLPCSPKVEQGDRLNVVEFECPYREDVRPRAARPVRFAPKLPGLFEYEPGTVDFPGTYDPLTFPTATVR